MFALGFIAGLIVATLIVVTLVYFRVVINHKVRIMEASLETVGPRVKGVIIMPDDDNEAWRKERIALAREEGVDLPFSELQ